MHEIELSKPGCRWAFHSTASSLQFSLSQRSDTNRRTRFSGNSHKLAATTHEPLGKRFGTSPCRGTLRRRCTRAVPPMHARPCRRGCHTLVSSFAPFACQSQQLQSCLSIATKSFGTSLRTVCSGGQSGQRPPKSGPSAVLLFVNNQRTE